MARSHRPDPPMNRTTPAFFLMLLLVCFASPVLAQSEAAPEKSRMQQLYAEAKSAEAQGNLSAATTRYESLLVIAPRLAPAYNNLGALYLRQREFKKAAAVLERGLKIDPHMS